MRLSPFARFVIAGALNTLATYLLFVLLATQMHHALAYTIAYGVGIVLGYVLNARFVFASGYSLKTALAFPSLYLVQYGYGIAVLTLLVTQLGVDSKLAAIFVIATSIPITFLVSKFIFSSPRRQIAG